MAKSSLDLAHFKKMSTNGKNTILMHPSGHKFIIQHSSLSPEHREQLHNLPFAEAATDKKSKIPSLPSADDPKAMSAFTSSLAKGGKVSSDPTQRHLMSGDKIPNKIEKQVVNQAKTHMKEGGSVPKPEAKAPNPKASPIPTPTDAPQDAFPSLPTEMRMNFAEGGATESADIGTPEVPAPETADDTKQIEHADSVARGDAPPIAPGSEPGAESEAAPGDAKAIPAPTTDPALARKRELYNFAVAQLNPSSGNDPRGVLGPNYTFGPNGEAPSQFNPAAWGKAEQQFQLEATNKASASNNAANAAVLENKARQAAGLPPIPVPQAAASAQEASAEAPTAGQTPQAMGNQQASGAAPQSPSDPYGTNAYYNAYESGIGEQKAGLNKEAAAQTAQGAAESAALGQGQQAAQSNIDNYNTHYNNLEQERQNFIKDVNDQKIDPNHYWNNKGTVGKISSAIGLILGGIGGGLQHTGKNAALDFMNDNINRDIDAQRQNLGKTKSLLEANLHQFGNLRDATDMTRAMQQSIVSNQLAQAAAKAQGPLAQARILQAKGQIDAASAPILSQIAMRKTLLGGMQSGQYQPEQVVRMIVPPAEQGAAFKELQSAQNMGASRDNLISAFDQLSKINTVGNRVSSPIQTPKQVEALRDPALAKLVKDAEGRVTPQDTKMIQSLFPSPGDNDQTQAVKRSQLIKFINEKMSFPMLKAYGINVGAAGRYAPSGKTRIPESAPITGQ